ncbi:CHASE2 domain-containing protein [Calothrix sp. NIES-2098]|uniref:CHASE2 domain-containing protein n=1 Tax=Calothrix sp. NIES-2098 TaxID=1954171 RepID=UPI000B5E90C6|nr:WD-40 repeat-containing protein [Calothrix sp. NIES-2098]
MSEQQINNDRSLQQLAWAIQASVGQFKLILAKCNYLQQRDRLIARLQEISAVKISVLVLKPSQRTLYTAIREECGDDIQALTILGLEKLQDLPQMLIAANQVREEFRKNLPFPIVLWVNDEIHTQMMQLAPDLESWATTKKFAITINELTNFLQQTASQLFDNILNINLELIAEIQSAWQELQVWTQDLTPELKANCDFVLGLVAYINKNLDAAIEHYNQSWDYWQTNNDFERQGKILTQITICYYEKARADDRNHPYVRNHEAVDAAFDSIAATFRVSAVNQETITNYLQQTIAAFQAAQRPDLIANSLDQFGIILRYLEDWQQLKTLAQQALIVHEAENNTLKISQDYSFLAETELAQQHWQPAQKLAETALKFLSTTHQPVPLELSPINVIAHQQKLLLIIAQAQDNLAQCQAAINNLEQARKLSITDNDPQLYLSILANLHSIYFEQKQYLKAFDAKLEARSIEQQFGLRAFIGAGRLQATKQLDTQVLAALQIDNQDNIAPEIAASGRQLDVERVIERIGRPDYKLIVIHGQSGVGKSSLVNAGLIPALKRKAIGVQDNLVVAIRVYTNWVEELGRVLQDREDKGDKERSRSAGFRRSELRRDKGELRRRNSGSEGDNSGFLPDSSSSEGESSSSEHDTPSFLLDNPSSEHDNPSFLLDTPSSEHDNPSFLLDNPSSEHDNPSFLPETPSSEHDNPSFLPETPSSEPQTSPSPLSSRSSDRRFPPFRLLSLSPLSPLSPSPPVLLAQLRNNEQRNLRTVLIFDQFEEFFFVYPEPKQRRQFFEFLGECLNILSVKVILSLRVDYLHYLLECNRLASLKIIGNDILSNNVLYELGNFSPDDAKAIIQRLTQNTSFYLEPALIDKLVQDLAGEVGEVRPIELQVIGAQLQTENITTLAKYQELGGNAKEELVKRYLAEVVDDCGVENQQAAELLLYLLTDEKGTRPLKTRTELERDLQALVADVAADSNKLDLILEIFVKSGLVVLLPENPADRYQLVHDYLAAFIRQQQEPKLKQVMAELEEERKQRKISEDKLLIFEQRQQANQTLSIAQARAKQEALPRKIFPDWKEIFGAITFICIIIILRSLGLLQLLELAGLDQLFLLRPKEPVDERIVIVEINEPDITKLKQWPINDEILSNVLIKIKQQKPIAIGLDIYRDLPLDPGHQKLVKVFETTPNLIGVQKVSESSNSFSVGSPPELRKRNQVGANDFPLDKDAKIRRALLYAGLKDGSNLESFGLKLALLYLQPQGITEKPAANNPNYLQLGKGIFPYFETNDGGYVGANAGSYQILLNYRGTINRFPVVSINDVLENRISQNLMRGKIVLIGATSESLNDLFWTPYSSKIFGTPERMPGVAIHANLISQILSSALEGRPQIKTLSEPIEWLWILVWSIVWSIVGSTLVVTSLYWQQKYSRLPLILLIANNTSSIVIVGGCGCLLGGSYLAFLSGWWLRFVPSILSLVGSVIITAIINKILTKNRLEKFQFPRTLELIFEICSTNPVVGCLSIEYLITATQKPEITTQSLSSIAVSALASCKNPDEIAPMVLFTCDKAVTQAPNNCKIRDSRGIARALTGDYQGAILDFEAYIAQTKDKDSRARRQRWVKDLKADKNPFTDDELKRLRNQ